MMKDLLFFKKKIKIYPSYTPNDLAKKIHDLEMKYFPKIVENLLAI